MEILLVIGLFLFVRMILKNSIERRIVEKRMIDQLLSDIPHTQKVFSENNLNALLINEGLKSNYLFLAQRDYLAEKFDLGDIEIIPFEKILEVAIVEDECVVSLFPGNGLLHSLYDSEETFIVEKASDEEDEDEENNTVEKLSLKIVVDDLTNTLIEFVLIENDKPKSKGSDEYTRVYELCEEWYQKLFIIIKRYEHEKVFIKNWQQHP
jgi:hypothetical protein